MGRENKIRVMVDDTIILSWQESFSLGELASVLPSVSFSSSRPETRRCEKMDHVGRIHTVRMLALIWRKLIDCGLFKLQCIVDLSSYSLSEVKALMCHHLFSAINIKR